MKVVQYLKEFGIDKLKEEFFIKVKEYEEGLLVLNYDQINSPKTHPIVMECRGLILDKNFNIVSRSFDRFFNLGEAPETQEHIDMSKAYLHDKIDGSLIKIYRWNGEWRISTRGTAFAESEVNGFDKTFQDLVLEALQHKTMEDFQWHCNNYLYPAYTYICEITSMENRVVTPYKGKTLWYLATRNNINGEYADGSGVMYEFGAEKVNRRFFNSIEDCVEMAKSLPNLEEGYVLYQGGTPVCKIKSPAYVAVHHIRGEGLNPKRIAQLVLTGEQDEYLGYFPEDKEYITPYIQALSDLKAEMAIEYASAGTTTGTQKDFAMRVKDFTFSSVLFTARKLDVGTKEAFDVQSDAYKLQLLLESVQ